MYFEAITHRKDAEVAEITLSKTEFRDTINLRLQLTPRGSAAIIFSDL
jgi:hypothetical protein